MQVGSGRLNRFYIVRGGFTYRFLQLCYYFLIIYCLYSLKDLYGNKVSWWNSEVFFSDWREAGIVDYSTNAIVSQWYSKKPTKYLREENIQEVLDKLNNGDTLIIGLDYYALFNISRESLMKINPKIYTDIYYDMLQGNVAVVKIWY